jgi:glucosylglycerate synthase
MIAEITTIPEQTKQRIEEIGAVDLVIGVADSKAGEQIAAVVDVVRKGLASLGQSSRTVLVHNAQGVVDASAAGPNGLEDESLRLLAYSLPARDASATLAETVSRAYRAIWGISEKLKARACAVIISAIETLTPQWISGLVQPVLEREFDLVAPCYTPQKFEGLLNSAILYPLTRAIYGRQIQNPLGPDFGFSARFFQSLLQAGAARARGATPGYQLIVIATAAIIKGFRVCQAHLGHRIYPPVDWKNLDSVLVEILGPFFLDVERDAPFWQHVRNSEPVPTYGVPFPLIEESVAVDVRRLLEPFHLGFRNLLEIWGLVLPPKTIFELKKIDRLPPEQFRMEDELWARIIYDFALAHRLRTIARDHLLRAMTPLYLGWVASYALGVESVGAGVAQRRLEHLCTAFENAKPYLLSRWRWPDRFNP